MSYIITATFNTDGERSEDGSPYKLAKLLLNPRFRLLSEDADNQTAIVDISTCFGRRKADTAYLTEKLVQANILAFEIGHSY